MSHARQLASMLILLLSLLLAGAPAYAQQFPELTGRVVDAANILSPETEAALTTKLANLETQSQRQFVIATVPDLQGYEIADFGYQLGRHWGIGDKERNDGVVLLIAPNERKMNISVGYGVEPVLTDALSGTIIRNEITPRFKEGDFDGGVTAGADAVIRQLTLPPEEAQRVAAAAAESEEMGNTIGMVIFWTFVVLFILLLIIGRKQGRHYSSKGSGGPIIVWGSGGSDWGGGGSSWGGGSWGGGGFSGGGGSFGGGGASGGW
ncbi:methanol dehydrogenase [Sphingomonas lacunae]|uniref:Methanol dehydrogenase n=1 Tax=Sphingomonas lacunae TaxID=2698828 RepID=A0A6M4AUK9_9SPHN|nr:TPM domain-containing protein [Sphingomonas lacunae]QJQ32724.1 methanol dehydrogenase [Sphingomonas lacunae]